MLTGQSEKRISSSEQDAREKQNLTSWIEKHVGGRVTKIERMPRWRPVWRAEMNKDGVAKAVLAKGERTDEIVPYSLDYEMRVNQVLEANGIRQIPHVYGMCDDPKAFVVDWLEGDRNADLQRATIAEAAVLSADRRAALLDYVDVIAKIHSIDPAKFEAVGVKRPVGAKEVALADAERYEKLAYAAGVKDPVVAFTFAWMRRNVPRNRTRCAFVTGDCGQFLAKGPKVSAVLDMEMGHLGDNLRDIACFRGRHPAEDLGDLSALFARYEKATGEPIDWPALAYHLTSFLSLSICATLILQEGRKPGGDWVEGQLQLAFIARRALEGLAECADVELDYDVELPAQPDITPTEDLGLRKLIGELEHLPATEAFAPWQRDIVAEIPRFLLNYMHYGHWAREEDLKDVAKILGHKPPDIKAANLALHDFALKAGPEHDAALVRFLHRRYLRHCHIMAGPGAPKDHLMFAKIEPVLKRSKT